MATILIAEDRPLDRKFLVTLLRSEGHTVLEVGDGGEALAMVERAPPDLIISDILMPTVDGYEFVRRLRRMADVPNIPVLFYTATYHESEARALAEQCGVVEILTKPSEPRVILAKVAAALAARADAGILRPEPADFDREHLRVVASALATNVKQKEAGEQRLAAIVDIAQQIAAEREPIRLLERVCSAAREVTLAQYAVLGLLDDEHAVARLITSGLDEGTTATLPPPSLNGTLLSQVIAKRHPVRRRNPGGDPEALQLPAGLPPIFSFLAVPIGSPSRVYGWIGLRNKLGAEEFSETDEELALTLATHAAVGYENARLYEDLRLHTGALEQEIAERRRAEQALRESVRLAAFGAEVGSALTMGTTVRQMLGLCAQAAVRHLEAALARIWTVNEAQNALELQASAGMYTHLTGRHSRIPVGQSEIGAIAASREPYVTNHVIGDGRIHDQQWAGLERMRSFAGYPLVVDDRLVGVLAIFARTPLSPGLLDALASVSRQIALGIRRKSVEERLRANQERMEFALSAARTGIWEVDLRTRAVSWSEALAKALGVAPEQSPSNEEEFFALVHRDDVRLIQERLSHAIAAREEFAVEFRLSVADGTVRWVYGRARVIYDADGSPARLLGIGMDISDRKLLEEQLGQAQKMEAIGQLAGGIAHDFNNLLTAILGYAHLFRQSLDPHDPRRLEVDEITKAGERAATLTTRLLVFSRKQVLQPTLVDVNALVVDMSHMLRRLIGENIALVVSAGRDLPRVRADATQLQQILLNLVVNARDAMPYGGRVTIETADVALDETYALQHATVRPGRYVMLAVSDTGIGMDALTKAHLFEPFFTTKERGKGTGLGLATVYGIVTQSGGYVWVYSEPQRGATFKVYLPHADPSMDSEPVAPAAPARHSTGSESVLLVEDEAAVRLLARRILETAGYRVYDAADPAEAEALFDAHGSAIDLLITDVIMPGTNGPVLFERLVQRSPILKVLYTSGYTDEMLSRGGGVPAGVAFLQKPFTAHGLARKVREVLDS